jgi:hypothetical protein
MSKPSAANGTQQTATDSEITKAVASAISMDEYGVNSLGRYMSKVCYTLSSAFERGCFNNMFQSKPFDMKKDLLDSTKFKKKLDELIAEVTKKR